MPAWIGAGRQLDSTIQIRYCPSWQPPGCVDTASEWESREGAISTVSTHPRDAGQPHRVGLMGAVLGVATDAGKAINTHKTHKTHKTRIRGVETYTGETREGCCSFARKRRYSWADWCCYGFGF